MYIEEAHPADGWQVEANIKEGFVIDQPQTLEERVGVARDFVSDMNIIIPVIVDGIDNKTGNDYKAFPDRIYIVGGDGKIIYKGAKGPRGYNPVDMIPILDTLAGVSPAGKLAATWGEIKSD